MSKEERQDWTRHVHNLNGVLHQEPVATIAHGLFWYLLLLITCPLMAFGATVLSAYRLLDFYLWKREILPKDYPDKELGVFVTGCDTGFGQELVFSLVSKGFTVFAACLSEDSFEQFQGEPRIIPIKVNITSDEDVRKAYETVCKWQKDDDKELPKKRHFHALVNNAGCGRLSLIDWMEVKDFEEIMNVNFFGTIRVVKAFLPLLKQQAATGSYKDARVVNMISTAGVFAGGVLAAGYECSKHALDAYTTNLRVELGTFGVKVTKLNPSMHKTALAESKNLIGGMRKIWDAMTPEHREEYGEDYFNAIAEPIETRAGRLYWDKKYVVEAMENAVVSGNPPERVMVGLDARYIVYPLSKLPTWFRVNIIQKTPAIMTQKPKAQ